jgi:hypothetical protein
MGLFDGDNMPKILSEKKKAPVSGKKSKTDQVQITTSDDDFTEPIAESTTN